MEGKMNLGFALRNVAIIDKNLYVGSPEIYSTIGTDDIVSYASKAAGVTKSCMLQTFIALYDAFEYYLCNGHSFKIDGLGTFSLSLSAATADPTAADTVSGSDAINRVGINFLADKAVKTMLNSIAWNTVVNKSSSLSEFTDFVPRSLVMGSDSASLLYHDGNEAHSLVAGSVLSLSGYNCPDVTSVVIAGLDESGEEISETFSFKLVASKTKTLMSAVAKATKNIPTIQKITVNGVDYEYSGTSKAITVKAGSNIITNGASFETGSYVLSFSGKNLSSLVAKLDDTTLAFETKTSTLAKTASIVLSEGSHTLVVNDETISFICTAVAVANVVSLSCNGVTVANGETSTMVEGQSYAMVANGQNLNLITVDQIDVPLGSTINGYTLSADNTKLQFNVVFGGSAGVIQLGEYFTVNINPASTSSVITTVAGIANGGSINAAQNSSYAIVAEDMTGMTAKLTNSSTGSDVTSSALTLDTTNKKITFKTLGSFKLVIYRADGVTTDYSANVTVANPDIVG